MSWFNWWSESEPICYGWKRDTHDWRDWKFEAHDCELNGESLISYRGKCGPIVDQGQLGSCTANAIEAALAFCEGKEGLPVMVRSRLFIYYNERNMEGTTDSDSGAEIRDGIKSINKLGSCPEEMWPYDISKFTEKPENKCYAVAKAHRTLKYERLNNTQLSDLLACLRRGFPFVFGVSVYSSFMSDDAKKTGDIPLPKEGEQLLGGHALLCVGYDTEKKLFQFQNSWSDDWGDEGYGTIPFGYLTNPGLASDFWVIQFTK